MKIRSNVSHPNVLEAANKAFQGLKVLVLRFDQIAHLAYKFAGRPTMRTSRGNSDDQSNFVPINGKMKVVEILEMKREALRVADLVQLLNISKSRLYQVIARGELPHTRKGGIRVDPNHVIEWWTRQ